MPELPSGLKLALNTNHILEPDVNWFKAPEGHFWYSVPDPEINSPPFAPQDEWLGSFVTAPVPQTIDEIKEFVHLHTVLLLDQKQLKTPWASPILRERCDY